MYIKYMSEYYDRYKSFRVDGKVMKVPYIKIDKDNNDIYLIFDKSKMRFDSLSYKYYGDANYAWLIMMANQQYGSMEYDFPDKIVLRIPYPLESALLRYERKIRKVQGRQ